MEKKTPKMGRRKFLQGSIQAFTGASGASTSIRGRSADGETLLEESKGPLPGEPGYRGPVDFHFSVDE